MEVASGVGLASHSTSSRPASPVQRSAFGQIDVQTELVTSAKAQVTQAEQSLVHLHDSQRCAERQAQLQAEEAAEVVRKLPEKQLAYVKRCWQYLVKHREKRDRRERTRRSRPFDYYGRRERSYWNATSYANYRGEWDPLQHPPAQVIRAAHRCHYMGLLRHKVDGDESMDHYSYEDLESAYKAGELTIGKLNYNNRQCGWHICTISPSMATWPNEHDFSIDSGPKDHEHTFFAFFAGPSYD